MGHVLGGHPRAPGPDGPVEAPLLNVYAAGKQLGPLRQHELRHVRPASQHQVRRGLHRRLFPGLRAPAVGKVLGTLRVPLGQHLFLGDLWKAGKGGVEGGYPIGDGAGPLGTAPHRLPAARLELRTLVPVRDNAGAFLADVHGPGRPVSIIRALLFFGPFQLGHDQLNELPAVGAGDEVMPLAVRRLLLPPDAPRFYRRGGGHEDLPVRGVGLGPLDGQVHRVRLLLGGPRILVHLVQKQVAGGRAGQAGRGVGPGEIDRHTPEFQPLGGAFVLQVLLRQRRGALNHGLQLGFHCPLHQRVGGIDQTASAVWEPWPMKASTSCLRMRYCTPIRVCLSWLLRSSA